MAKIKGIVQEGKAFTYKGEQYQPGDEVTFQNENDAALYEKNDYVKLDKEAEKKIQKFEEKQEKNDKAGPNPPKTK